MGLFDKNKQHCNLSFSTRQEAFTYMLGYLINEKCLEPMEAAKQANEFAEIFATNMGIPLKLEPEPKGVDKYLSMAEKIGNYIEQHPKVVEYGIPALTFVAGLFTGKKVEQVEDKHDGQMPQPPVNEQIDFDKID